MRKPSEKEIIDTARTQADRIICTCGLEAARGIVKLMVDIVEAKAVDLTKKYGPKL